MSITTIIISIFIFGVIIGGVLVLKKTARKFNLTEQQLKKIKERNKALDKEEQEREN
jgi:uncharacterized membrane protein (DUF106 family)|tara:strand:- start:75 stop:245 length:171 start_codon:yes stop_codon:yes gene_type:complete